MKNNQKWFTADYNKKFNKIIVENADAIGFMVFGHHHTDTFHLVKNEKGEAIQAMFISPAVTPWISDLSKNGNNPSYRVFKCDKDWNIVDIE